MEDAEISRLRREISQRSAPGKALRERLLSAHVAKRARTRGGRKPQARARRTTPKRKHPSLSRSKPRTRRKPVKSARARSRRGPPARRVSKPARPTDPFDFRPFEPTWQAAWEKAGVYIAPADPTRPKWDTTLADPDMKRDQQLRFGSSLPSGAVP